MYKVVLWGLGGHYNLILNSIRYYELKNEIEVIGISSDEPVYDKLDGYKYINSKDISYTDYDLLVINDDKCFKYIYEKLISLGVDKGKIIRYQVFLIPNLNLEKYLAIKKSQISIFANNCWGGLIYKKMGLEALSPFINMSVREQDYLTLLSDPKKYLDYPLIYRATGLDPDSGEYPICTLGGVKLHFNHHQNFETAYDNWNRRKQRINWNNLFVMMYTVDRDAAMEFTKLPYKNKVCFVPFETNEDSLLYIDLYNKLCDCWNKNNLKQKTFWRISTSIAAGHYNYYDIIELLSGNKNKLRVE